MTVGSPSAPTIDGRPNGRYCDSIAGRRFSGGQVRVSSPPLLLLPMPMRQREVASDGTINRRSRLL
jgi:hypothetical protein